MMLEPSPQCRFPERWVSARSVLWAIRSRPATIPSCPHCSQGPEKRATDGHHVLSSNDSFMSTLYPGNTPDGHYVPSSDNSFVARQHTRWSLCAVQRQFLHVDTVPWQHTRWSLCAVQRRFLHVHPVSWGLRKEQHTRWSLWEKSNTPDGHHVLSSNDSFMSTLYPGNTPDGHYVPSSDNSFVARQHTRWSLCAVQRRFLHVHPVSCCLTKEQHTIWSLWAVQ